MRYQVPVIAVLVVAALALPAVALTPPGESDVSAPDQDPAADLQTDDNTTRPGISGLAFFTVSGPGGAPPVRIGFSARADADGFFVLKNGNGTIVGRTDYQTFSGHVAVDGLPVPFTREVSGVVDLTVIAYDDTDGDGAFDPSVDDPYRYADGDRVASSMVFVFPNETGALTPIGYELKPSAPGVNATHQYHFEAQRDLTVRAVAIDLRGTGIDVSEVRAEDVGVVARYPELSPWRTGVASVHEPTTGVLVARRAEPLSLSAGENLLVNIRGIRTPTDAENVTVLVNPDGAGHAATQRIRPAQVVPAITMVQVRPVSRDTAVVNLHFPGGKTGVVVVERGGTVIGRSEPVGGVSHIDFLEVPLNTSLSAGDTITVTLYRDADGDGTYETPFTLQDRPIARTLTVLQGLETTEPTTDRTPTTDPSPTPSPDTGPSPSTPTTTPGLGVFVALLSLLAAVALLRRE
ncbi:MAG: hypothetical protein ABEJ71_01150 [Halodesulfurarchaeum sp.]